jgi:hypothetical protein
MFGAKDTSLEVDARRVDAAIMVTTNTTRLVYDEPGVVGPTSL